MFVFWIRFWHDLVFGIRREEAILHDTIRVVLEFQKALYHLVVVRHVSDDGGDLVLEGHEQGVT